VIERTCGVKGIPRILARILEQLPGRGFHRSPDPPCTGDRSDGWDRRRGLDEPHLRSVSPRSRRHAKRLSATVSRANRLGAMREQVYGEWWTVADSPTQPVTTSPTDWPPPNGSPALGDSRPRAYARGTLRTGGQECGPTTDIPVRVLRC